MNQQDRKPEAAAAANDNSVPAGLTSSEAQRRLAEVGPNATPDAAVHPLRLILSKFIAPVPCLLEAAIVLQLYLHEYLAAGVVAFLLLFNAALSFFHESRAQATLEALKSRLALWASTKRDGAWSNIPASDLVPGDIVKLTLGGVVPADVKLLAGDVLFDQSTITGESLPIEASAGTETYAGVLVKRGEAVATVTATGGRTKFGRAAELVRSAHVISAQQKAIFRVVRNLAFVNGAVAAVLLGYAYWIAVPVTEFVPLVLITLLATVPVALPATFTLATALGAQALAKCGVLPTRLSAVDEAASMDVLCSDKTGTLTRNELAVTAVRAMPGFDENKVIALAALASSEGGQDPVDRAVRMAAHANVADLPTLIRFIPFDPANKMAEAVVANKAGRRMRVVKGAFAIVARLCAPLPDAAEEAETLERQGYRVLGVAIGTDGDMRLAGLLALSDPPRTEAAECIAQLRNLGIDVVMVTGDAPATAAVVAHAVGIDRPVYPPGPIREAVRADEFGVFAGVLPEHKFNLVQAFQKAGHTVGMCGDGANDAPALRQAQIGIAVSTATDAAKSAAGLVLTEPGLAGIVAAVHEGRITFQRILTYTLRSLVNKVRQVLFLAFGLVITGHPIITPLLMVMLMIAGDFLAMSSTTDNVRASALPNRWRIDRLTVAGVLLGLGDLVFCAAILTFGYFWLRLPIDALQTLTAVTLVFNGQAVFYVSRERRRLWSSRPSWIVVASSIADISIIPTFAAVGLLMTPLPLWLIGVTFLSAVALALVLDQIKLAIFSRLQMVE
ncbi:HAD-IC family P-type ATPase [Microbacteriaceae bacterium K1510]|nr:HAD-IC family P-type ATPase [Microbacteriaceae bacterium K1510]